MLKFNLFIFLGFKLQPMYKLHSNGYYIFLSALFSVVVKAGSVIDISHLFSKCS